MNGKSVLVIEDDAEIRNCLAEALIEEGYDVVAARNGAEGIELLERSPKIALVVLDLMMPVMNGYEFMRWVRERDTYKHIPVLVVSANVDRRRMDGVSEVIRKPFDLDDLFRSVNKVTEHSRSA